MELNRSPGYPIHRLSRRSVVGRAAGAGIGAAIATTSLGPARAAEQLARNADQTKGTQMTDTTPTPRSAALTVMIVHGAFADSSGFSGVIELLQEAGVPVVAPPNLLRGVNEDSAYIASALGQIPGPVLLVGHSYGGMVISNAATEAPNAVGLVYIAGFAPEVGESLIDIEGDSRDSVLGSSLMPLQYPTGNGDETAVELIINPELFHEAFAADLPKYRTAAMAAFQRPAAERAFGEKSAEPAWKKLPTWAVIPTGDLAAGTDVLRTMAERAGAMTTELEGSHAIMISQPKAVFDAIMTAVSAVS